MIRRSSRSKVALSLVLALAASGAVLTALPSDARACGGCFAPPVDNTVVSYHRMVLSISTKETTLYDQIRYSGSPSSFAWVLPIRGEAKIGLSADAVFSLIDQNTQTSWNPPPMNCPAPPSCPSRYGTAEDSAGAATPSFAADAGTTANSVDVLKQETVGPYETVQLKSTSPSALADWLTSHGYNIPDDIKPLIASYVTDGFDFLALKLVPGTGVQSMKPVRVTTAGAAPSLPLRMVAAGSGATVGVTLWIVGDGRWEPQSFPSFSVPASEVTWTWATYSSDYAARRQAHIAELGDAAWEIENSDDFASYLVTNPIRSYATATMPTQVQLPDGGFGQLQIYDPVTDAQGNVTKTSAEVMDEDMTALFQGKTSVRMTRMKSDLPRASLATDLIVQAGDQSVLPRLRKITKEADEPNCPVYQGCKYVGTAPRSKAKQQAESSCGDGTSNQFCGGTSAGGGCAIHEPRSARDLAPWGLAALGIVLAGLRRRRAV